MFKLKHIFPSDKSKAQLIRNINTQIFAEPFTVCEALYYCAYFNLISF